MKAGKYATAEQVDSIRVELGLNQPLINQYFSFLKQSATLNFGKSWSGSEEHINTMLSHRLGATLSLTIPAFLISTGLCILIALTSLLFKQGFWDRTLCTLSLGLMSISYLVYIMSFQYFFAFKLGAFPISGYDTTLIGRWEYLYLPWLISITVSLGPGILIYRSALLDEIHKDYVRTAKSKGLHKVSVYFKHILKNALVPIITIIFSQIPFLILGSLLLETFFSIPGVGNMLYRAINEADFPVIKALTIIGSLIYILSNIISDVLYTIVDPRVRIK